MLRFVVLFAALVLLAYVILNIARYLKSRPVDWTGLALAAGFVALAFYLRHATGWG